MIVVTLIEDTSEIALAIAKLPDEERAATIEAALNIGFSQLPVSKVLTLQAPAPDCRAETLREIEARGTDGLLLCDAVTDHAPKHAYLMWVAGDVLRLREGRTMRYWAAAHAPAGAVAHRKDLGEDLNERVCRFIADNQGCAAADVADQVEHCRIGASHAYFYADDRPESAVRACGDLARNSDRVVRHKIGGVWHYWVPDAE